MEARILIGSKGTNLFLQTEQKIGNEWIINPYLSAHDRQNIRRRLSFLLKSDLLAVKRHPTQEDMLVLKTENARVFLSDSSLILKEKELIELNKKIKSYLRGKKVARVSQKLPSVLQEKAKLTALTISAVALIGVSVTGLLALQKEPIMPEVVSQTLTLEQPVKTPDFSKIMDEVIENMPTPVVQPEDSITKIAKIYGVDPSKAHELVEASLEEYLDKSLNEEVAIYRILAKEHWQNPNIDKTPSYEPVTEEMAYDLIETYADLYQIDDPETRENLHAIHALETNHGTDALFTEGYNFGGVRDDGVFLTYQNPHIGAESFVRTYLNIVSIAQSQEDYVPSGNILYDINYLYCPDASPFSYDKNGNKVYQDAPDGGFWFERVESVKNYNNSNLRA